MKMSVFLVTIGCLLISASSQAKEKLSADEILRKVQTTLKSNDEVAKMEMTITEKNGNTIMRNIIVKKKNEGKKQQVLVRLEKPTDIRGVGLLSVIEGSSEDQWLYLPSSKRSRRIISSSKKDSFLGSEFSYEDFSPTTYNKFTNKIVKMDKVKGQPAYLIESKTAKSSGPYSKILTWVSENDFKVLQSQYYDENGKKLKVMTFKNYKKYGDSSWRAQTIDVKNVQNSRSTQLMLSELKLNTGLSDNEFSKRALESY